MNKNQILLLCTTLLTLTACQRNDPAPIASETNATIISEPVVISEPVIASGLEVTSEVEKQMDKDIAEYNQQIKEFEQQSKQAKQMDQESKKITQELKEKEIKETGTQKEE